jgi:molecular chaperone GrpE
MSQSEPQEHPPASPGDESAAASAPGADAESAKSPAEVIEGLEAELARTRDRLLRTAADYDNYRKRTRRDISDAERQVQESILLKLLPTFDNLERATSHVGGAQDLKALTDGIGMVLKQFQDALVGLGVERVSTEGQAFDPAAHEAVQHVETDQQPAGSIARELQAGYRWQGRLLRPALVVVAKTPAGAKSS